MTDVTFKPRMSRPRKDRAGILTEEQAEALMSPGQIAERKARQEAAAKGKETRQLNALAAERRKLEEQMSQAPTFTEYWQMQRATLTPDERSSKEARQENVLDIEWLMTAFLEGTYDAQSRDFTREERVTLTQLIAEVKEEIAAHGVCESIILAVPRLWTADEKDLRERILAKGGPTVDLLRYGYRTGLDSFLVNEFRERFMTERHEFPQTDATITCKGCGAQTSVHVSTAEGYRRIGGFTCFNCKQAHLNLVAPNRALAAEYKSPESQIYDQYGRLKDQ